MTMKERRTNRSFGRPEPINGVVERLFGSLGYLNRYHGWQVVAHWPEIVGEHYARHCRAFKFDDGTVYVAVKEDGWRQRLSLESEMIVEKIRGYAFGRSVRKLRLVREEKGSVEHGDRNPRV
jgi:predicted nucleic acid-binding Zn ribbon protein